MDCSEEKRVMDKLERFSHAVDTLNRVIGRARVWLILASIVVSAGNAVMRKFFGLASNFWLAGQCRPRMIGRFQVRD
jgi:TRAP-type mannitol/chloroaromatic compound transport system permease small subunit